MTRTPTTDPEYANRQSGGYVAPAQERMPESHVPVDGGSSPSSGTTAEMYRFRIRPTHGQWRVETWDAEPPYGPGWSPALSGARTIEEARSFFDTASVLRWDDDSRRSGVYSFAAEASA